MLVVDTNVISELRKARTHAADPRVLTWSQRVATHQMFLSVISLLELEIGVQRLERRDPHQGAALRQWLDQQVVPAFENRILPIDASVARRCAALHVPDQRPDRDALIAATALVHGMAVVSRNEDDFAGCGVEVINPWREGVNEPAVVYSEV